jgi:hypothetical protein
MKFNFNSSVLTIMIIAYIYIRGIIKINYTIPANKLL